MNEYVSRLIEYFGGQDSLAKALNLSQSAVSQWLNQKTNMRELHARKIEKLTGGKFRAVDLCPALAEIEAMEVPESPNP